MKKSTIVLLGLLILSLTYCVIPKRSPDVKDSTHFPKNFFKDYFPKQYTARVVFPDDNKQNIWVKGSEQFNKVRIAGGGSPIQLEAPFYTAFLNSTADSVTLEFFEDDTDIPHTIQVYPVNKNSLQNDTNFSFLVYGCFQPFDIIEEDDSNIVIASTNLEYEFRKTFEKISTNYRFEHHSKLIDDHKMIDKIKLKDLTENPLQKNSLLTTPTLLLGTGDQVYVDAAYYAKANNNPITAWESGKNPKPLLKIENYNEHLNKMYLHFGSFRSLENVLRRIPHITAIDDHEIRDGWGSQGDEYINEKNGFENLDTTLKPYFFAAREAFYQHQVATGPEAKNYSTQNKEGDLHLELESNGIPIFVFDLRSHRNLKTNTTIDSLQMADFEKWIDKIGPEQEIILVSTIPFFWEIPFLFRQSIKSKPEIRDELVDFWSSNHNEKQRNEIFKILIRARLDKNIKPYIFSGDVHIGAINEIWFSEQNTNGTKEKILLAHEMIISGFAHKELANQTFASQLGSMSNREDKTIVSDLEIEGYNSTYSVEGDMVFSAAKLNFGAFEKYNSATFLNIFFKDKEKMMQLKFPSLWNVKSDTVPIVKDSLYHFPDNPSKSKVILLNE